MDAAIDGANVIVVAEVHRQRARDDFLSARRVVGHHQLAGLDDRTETLVVLLDQVGPAIDLHQGGAIGLLLDRHGCSPKR
ncbi:hypothetical protein D9M68_996680 [compost metagenome]